jgi:hypothetical protein
MPFSSGAARIYPSHLKSTRQCPLRQALPGSTFHAWRALTNALFGRHRSGISPASREHLLILPSSSCFEEYYSPLEGTRQCSLCSVSGYHPHLKSSRQCSLCPSPTNELTHVGDHSSLAIPSSPCFAGDIPHVQRVFANALFAKLQQGIPPAFREQSTMLPPPDSIRTGATRVGRPLANVLFVRLRQRISPASREYSTTLPLPGSTKRIDLRLVAPRILPQMLSEHSPMLIELPKHP